MRRRSGLISSAVCAVLMGSGVAIGGVGPTVAEVAPDMATALAPGMLDDVAQRIRRLHLAAFGIEAASGQVQASVERARAEQEVLRSRHEKAAAQVERVRTAMARRAGAAIAAGRLNLDSRAVATRRAALQAQGISWNQAERELRDLRTAQVRLAAVVLDGERLGQELDLRAGQVAQQRDEIDDQPFAAVAMASRLRRLDQPVRQFAYRDETVVPPETDTMSLPRLAPAAMLTSAVPDEPAGPASPAGGAIRWPAKRPWMEPPPCRRRSISRPGAASWRPCRRQMRRSNQTGSPSGGCFWMRQPAMGSSLPKVAGWSLPARFAATGKS
jgi:hypothetical protein